MSKQGVVKNLKNRREEVSLFLLILSFYLFFQSKSIYGGDAGDLVSSAYTFGVAHPPGYPLYTFLGYLLSRLPIYTVAWRLSLLSSIPSALAVFFVFKSIKLISNRTLPALFGSLTLAFSYLFWLYASVPETFALYSFFVSLIVYLSLKWIEFRKISTLYLLIFSFSLSSTHHHLISLFLPALLFMFIFSLPRLKTLSNFLIFLLKSLCLAILGFLPYIYVVIASKLSPPINWDNPVNLSNFIRLILRSDYGTFGGPQTTLSNRLINLYAYFNLLIDDFSLPVVLLAGAGLFFLFKKSKKQSVFLFLAFIFSGILFISYGALQLVANFILGTIERTYTGSYVIVSVLSGLGFYFLSSALITFLRKANLNKYIRTVLVLQFVLMLVPLLLLLKNNLKFRLLKNDYTAENLGYDILNTVGNEKTILFLSGDTPLFNSQYIYYTQEGYDNIVLIHTAKLSASYYRQTLIDSYPDIKIYDEGSDKPASTLVRLNQDDFAIYSYSPIGSLDGVFIPHGLLYKYRTTAEDKLTNEQIIEINDKLWVSYHDPMNGVLGRFNLLTLSNVLDHYDDALVNTAKLYTNVGFNDKAVDYLLKARKYSPENKDINIYLAQAYVNIGKCEEAENEYLDTLNDSLLDSPVIYKYLGELSADCFKDPIKAKSYNIAYEEKLSQSSASAQITPGLLELFNIKKKH